MGENGSKNQQQQQPPVKKLNEMNKEELKAAQKTFKKSIRDQTRDLDREINKIAFEKTKSQNALQQEVKKGEKGDKYKKQMLAKQVLQVNKMTEKYMICKAQVSSVDQTIDQYFVTVKMGQIMSQSGQIMKAINSLMNIPEMQASMVEMQKEMMKMGIINEMIEDTVSNLDGDAIIDNEEEVNNLIHQMELDLLKKNPNVVLNNPNQQQQQQPQQYVQQQQQQVQQVMMDGDDDFEQRLNNLKNN